MKILVAIWLSAIVTFGVTAGYMLPNEASIDASGELGENFFAIGYTLLTVLLVMTAIALPIIFRNAKKRDRTRSTPAKT